MSLRKRPTRYAVRKAAPIIELSDDESGIEELVTPSKKRRIARVSSVKEQHNSIQAKNSRKQTQKETKSKNNRNKNLDNLKPVNDCESNANVNDTNNKLTEADSESHTVIDVNNGALRSTESQSQCQSKCSSVQVNTGRSSFWERRKVWTIPELLAETTEIEPDAAKNIVQLFENENTIPFICRYRRDLVNNIEPERLREIKDTYTEIVQLRKRAETIVGQLRKEKVIDDDIRTEMLCAKTVEELEFMYAPYKPASKGSLAERAKALGLEMYAKRLLYGELPEVIINSLVNVTNPSLDNEEKIIVGICHIISHIIGKHTDVLENLRQLQKVHRIILKVMRTKTSTDNEKKSTSKFESYYDFQNNVQFIKPHQILAINRGEKQKSLSVKLIIPEQLKYDIKCCIKRIFMNNGIQYALRTQIFERSFEECYIKKLQPLLNRQIRGVLNEKAKKASIEVFAKNLKQLLLTSPLKGERITGIDPGFKNGCKYAVISETANVLETGVLYPHLRDANSELCGEQLSNILKRHNCKLIALGNGSACRETEHWLTKLFALGIIDVNTIRYSIVPEHGASIYSCSNVAKKEFPNLDRNFISADMMSFVVSIARRLNDPLSEYVKIEPRHIGVGMYQHDINEKYLNASLQEVVSECVSYVGVDINTASISVLKYVAGLSEKKADKIIQYRLQKGPFRSRNDLRSVKSIGEKTFTQCAGFIRIEPRGLGGVIDNLLDCTWVHPESYDMAKLVMEKCQLNLKDIGSHSFIQKIKQFTKTCDMQKLAESFNVPKERLEVVLEALQRELFQDYRGDFDKKPLFKQGLTRINQLTLGDIVTGAVINVTHFGAFIDIGVECPGLIHIHHMNNVKLNIGDRVVTSIIKVDIARKRVSLQLKELLLSTELSLL